MNGLFYSQVLESVSLLSAVRLQDKHKKCVVIDLDETLVHSSFVVSSYYFKPLIYIIIRVQDHRESKKR